ncbi:G-protein-signaling modulator 2, partial [Candidatus Magnetoovum chiemensis]
EELRRYVRGNLDSVTTGMITAIAKAGLDNMEEGYVIIGLVSAQEKGDKQCLADVYQNAGDYYLYTSRYDKAADYYEKALPLYEALNDDIGHGNVYKGKGDIYSSTSEYAEAIKMYDKALVFFERAQWDIGQGNVYFSKGEIYRTTYLNKSRPYLNKHFPDPHRH